MSYAFIEDVYNTNRISNLDNDYNQIVENILGIKPSNKYNLTKKIDVQDFSNKVPEVEEIEKVKKVEEVKVEHEKSEIKNKKENFNNEPSYKDCEDFLRHLEKCQRCRMLLIKKFNLDKKPEDYKREEYLDIVIYALSGVFLLFLIDIILNFGKNLNKI